MQQAVIHSIRLYSWGHFVRWWCLHGIHWKLRWKWQQLLAVPERGLGMAGEKKTLEFSNLFLCQLCILAGVLLIHERWSSLSQKTCQHVCFGRFDNGRPFFSRKDGSKLSQRLRCFATCKTAVKKTGGEPLIEFRVKNGPNFLKILKPGAGNH